MVVNEMLPDSTISEMLATVNGLPATPSKIKPAQVLIADNIFSVNGTTYIDLQKISFFYYFKL